MSPKIRTIEWGIVPVGCEAGEPRSRGCRRADAAADDRGVVEDVRDIGMDVARPERDHRLRGRGVDALARGRGPARRLREHPEDRRLVQGEPAVPRPDPEHDLLGRDPVAVLERVHAGLGWIAGGEDVADEVLRLVHAAQDRVLATEHLHRDDGVDALPFEDALRAGEVHVTRRAGQDLRRWTGVG